MIDRGLAYVCGGEPYGEDKGCGLYFCGKHLIGYLCKRCEAGEKPFSPKPDHLIWIRHKLFDSGWQQWREENPKEVKRLKEEMVR